MQPNKLLLSRSLSYPQVSQVIPQWVLQARAEAAESICETAARVLLLSPAHNPLEQR